MNLPYLNPASWDDTPSSKFASHIQSNPEDCQVALIGLPDDTGVQLNNGRPGAKEGPAAFRQAVAKYGVSQPSGLEWPTVFDAGDVDVVQGNLHETHRRITEAVKSILDHGLFPIGVGGGHDLTFPFVRAVADKFGPLDGVYFDPHLDVRESDGSGMPFRRLIETKAAKSLRIHGFGPMSNSREHVAWFQSNGGHIDSSSTPTDPWSTENTFVSLDLDVIDAAHAPGVSAMNPSGWSPETTEQWVRAAGRNPSVKCFDIMELSPPNDHLGRTAKLAAHLFLGFLNAYSERPQ